MADETKTSIFDRSSSFSYNFRNEQIVREKQISIETMNIVRAELVECVRTENVNSYTACKDLRDKYWALCIDKDHGMLFPPGSEPAERKLPGYLRKKSTV